MNSWKRIEGPVRLVLVRCWDNKTRTGCHEPVAEFWSDGEWDYTRRTCSCSRQVPLPEGDELDTLEAQAWLKGPSPLRAVVTIFR